MQGSASKASRFLYSAEVFDDFQILTNGLCLCIFKIERDNDARRNFQDPTNSRTDGRAKI